MDRKRTLTVFFVLLLFLAPALSACSANANTPETDDTPSPAITTPAPTKTSVGVENYHIGVVTFDYTCNEDEARSGDALVKEFGDADKDGIIKHVFQTYFSEDENEKIITELADDPLMKAIIVNVGYFGTTKAFRKIREDGRDDILLMVAMSSEDPNIIPQVADVIVDSDNFTRGYYDIVRAKNMGATAFVFMSFPRHMEWEGILKRKTIYEEACKDLGIEFVYETVPDPSELGVAAAQQQVYNMISYLVEKYGKDTAFFTTHYALYAPIIKRVIELGAIFVDQDDMSPLWGFPSALWLDLSAQIGDWPAIVNEIEKAVVAAGGAGRAGSFPYSINYQNTLGLVRLAMDMIEGKATGNLQNDLIAAYESLTPGCEWLAQPYGIWDSDAAQERSNYFFLSMDTYIFGQGYSGVFSEPFPEKYYNLLKY